MEVRLLGPLEVLRRGAPLQLGGKQRRTLLAILAVNAGRAVSTDRIVDELWGESAPETARKSVQSHVAHLRGTLNLEHEVLAPSGDGYILQVKPEAVDIHRFERLLEEGRQLRQADSSAAIERLDQALALFRGPPLMELADEAHSLRVEKSRIEELRLAALEERLETQLRSGDSLGAAVEAERLVAEYPLRERLWSLLMLSLYLSGRQAEALSAFSRVRRVLAEELGIEPSAELRDLEQRILDQDPALEGREAEVSSNQAAGMAPAAALRRFPVASTSLIGRENLLKELIRRISASRLVTLTGVAGSGKTRMAIEVGNRIASEFENGAVFVDLTPLKDPSFVAAAVSTSLGISGAVGSSSSSEDLVVAYLSQRDTLVVLDNCEHVMRGVSTLIDNVLVQCPDVKILATSRQGFAVPAESLLMVPPLELPNGDSKPSEEVESVRLLVERAEAVRSGLDLLDNHREAVVAICQRLDGLPLAIELAAVQLAHLTPEDIAKRLDQRFQLLGSRQADASPRSTLETALDWSYELLPTSQSTMFKRLGVFAGSFSLEAAEVVCSGPDIDRDQVAEILGLLVWKSMVLATPSEEQSRFRLLETMRDYARQRLEETGQFDGAAARHCEWFVSLVEKAAPHLTQADADTWLSAIERDLGNFRSALSWAVESADAESASRLMAGLWRYWHMRGDPEEGQRWAASILAIQRKDPATRIRTLEAAGGLAWWSGDMDVAIDRYEEALKIVRSHGSEADVAEALYNASMPYGFADETETALAYAEEARMIYERLGDDEGVAKASWGWGASAHAAGRDSEAVVAYEKALAIYETLDDTFMLGWAHRMLGRSLLALNDLESAKIHLDSGIGLFDAADDVSGVILHLRDYAELAMQGGDHERAVLLAGAVRALEEESGLNLVEGFSQQVEGLDEARNALGEDRARQVFDQGRRMSRSHAIQHARS